MNVDLYLSDIGNKKNFVNPCKKHMTNINIKN